MNAIPLPPYEPEMSPTWHLLADVIRRELQAHVVAMNERGK